MEKGRGDRGEEGRDFFGVFFCLRLGFHESLLLILLKKNAKGFLNCSFGMLLRKHGFLNCSIGFHSSSN